MSDLNDLKQGDIIDPRNITPTKEQIENYSSPPTGNTKRQKKILCVVLTAVKGAMPTITAKPKKVKYKSRWFKANDCTYFINKKALIDVGKHYLYMTTEDNAVGACYLAEHQEFSDSNQVELMTNQHAVEVFKKHKGISPKLVLIIAVVAMIAVLAVVIMVIQLIGMNNTIVNQKTQITNLQTEITKLKNPPIGVTP
jgi:hypothetical protein